MSRKFELLQRVEQVSPCTLPSTRLDSLGREEILKLMQYLFPQNSSARQMVVFAGIEKPHGSSWMCACLGDLLAAQTAARVCVADMNSRQPLVHQHFAMENGGHGADLLAETGSVRSCVQRLSKTLWLFPGDTRALVTPRMNAERMQCILSELRGEFEYLIVNSAPISSSAEAIALGQLAEGMVLVVEADATRREVIKRAKENLLAAGVNVFGAVLNNRTFPVPELIYKLF